MSDTKATQESGVSANRFPANATLQHAAKLGVVEDKPIMMDYWKSSVEQTAMLGLREETQEKLLVKVMRNIPVPLLKSTKVKMNTLS